MIHNNYVLVEFVKIHDLKKQCTNEIVVAIKKNCIIPYEKGQ